MGILKSMPGRMPDALYAGTEIPKIIPGTSKKSCTSPALLVSGMDNRGSSLDSCGIVFRADADKDGAPRWPRLGDGAARWLES